jgi:hypothetical protein
LRGQELAKSGTTSSIYRCGDRAGLRGADAGAEVDKMTPMTFTVVATAIKYRILSRVCEVAAVVGVVSVLAAEFGAGTYDYQVPLAREN